jgi:hypothetical protein
MAGSNIDYTIALKERQHEFLKQMVEKYQLEDESKALRCLVDFAIGSPKSQDDIFQTIRCFSC